MKRSRAATIGLVAFTLVVLCDLVYAVILFGFGLDPQSGGAVNTTFRVATIGGPVLVFWLAVAATTTRRRPVAFAAIGVTAWAVGAALNTATMGPDGYLESPSPTDLGYLGFYFFVILAFLSLGTRGSRRAIVPVALEGAIAGLGTASVLLVLVQPVLESAVSNPLSPGTIINLAYPLLDVALVAISAGYASTPKLVSTRRPGWFAAGITAFVAADLAYALLVDAGTYRAGDLIDMGWPIGFALLAWWALGFVKPSPSLRTRRPIAALGLIAPILAVGAAIAVLVYASQRQVNIAAVVVATLTVALAAVPVLTRQSLLSRLVAGQEQVVTELRELDVSKSEMMATLNHEMRTPLTSILGYLEVVRDGDGGEIPPAADEMLAAVEHNAKRLHSIVDEMLILTRLDSHGLDVQMAPLDPAGVVQRVVDQLGPVAAGRQVALLLEIDGDAPMVLGDDARLGHAITTVTENAIKFTPNGGIVNVGISLRNHHRPIVITVSDTGMGVPPADLPHLFERFYRASNAVNSAVMGSGLGLAIAHGIVELHGGRIRAESELGEGTTMIITLPAAE